ncbi:MAG: polyprenol monophosphomannose synthase, partial [Pseudomonadota bacterium]
MLSIVVPTYCEADNLVPLTKRLHAALVGVDYEIIIADDRSPDDTVTVCGRLADQYPLTLIQPDWDRRDLSLSVIDGINTAKFSRILVMDADLSHPPEKLTEMLELLDHHPGHFVLGSRYSGGGGFDRSWSLWRFLNSHIATTMAWPLVSCSDPMSGFFMFDRDSVDMKLLKPIGYKIGLELMVRGAFEDVLEVPIRFVDRAHGESKMSLRQQFNYLRHLRRLYLHKFGSLAEFV